MSQPSEQGSIGKVTYISAGDIEKYGYCPLSWWYSLQDPGADAEADQREQLNRGALDHEEFGKELREIQLKEVASKRSERTILWFAAIATLISIVGVTFLPEFSLQLAISRILGIVSLIWLLAAAFFLFKSETVAQGSLRLAYTRLIVVFAMVAVIISIYAVTFFLEPNETLSSVLELMALFWLVGASFFLYRSLLHIHLANLSRSRLAVEEGEISYVDLEKHKPKMLESKRYGLRGRPDYILFKDGEHIPVEVKTGRTPQGPLFSHILQVATYCLLLQEAYGKAPSHGILRYQNIEHDIEFTNELKELVLSKVEEMHRALETGTVHRNHNRRGKCRNCSRRNGCVERLN